ncbi:hypothetical protein [Xenorhabdus bovienii]|uniref:Uncharacterized protein n=1 Tax=Xenorhabdus bovienii TaxID=40576 RepID=A0A0B6XC16_XENBV|nr:hypothetical protein [Xenorhabdus bovienii]CDM91145.1 protein of unknown function [Xenorhabdus bovienii]
MKRKDICREYFEKEIKSTYAFNDDNYPTLAQDETGKYYNIITQSRWENWKKAWNASRDIKIDLPNFLDCNKDDKLEIEYNRGISHCQNFLESQGIKVNIIVTKINSLNYIKQEKK